MVGSMCSSLKVRLLLSIIKLTSLGQAKDRQFVDETNIPLDTIKEFLNNLARENHIKIEDGIIKTSPEQRINLATLAIKEGADIERVCKALGWREFEDLVVMILEHNGFTARKHFRFKSTERRYEIDALGLRDPLILSIECKHWQRSWQRAAMIRAVEAQIERTKALIQSFPNLKRRLKIEGERKIEILPLVLTLSETPLKISKKVPIVPIYHFQSFLNEMQMYMSEIEAFKVKTS